ncbi:MAG TPA: hypothetical protein VLB47_00095, partial [Solirubrobacteraceae bacterium]|nr:hypothetical protein [Solirubrobacteraceae bacterium]
NGHRHERAFVENVRRNGILNEADLMLDSYGGRFSPRALPVVVESLPAVLRAVLRGKIGRAAIGHPHRGRFPDLRGIFDRVARRPRRLELKLYVSGYDDDPTPGVGEAAGRAADASATAPGPNARRSGRSGR